MKGLTFANFVADENNQAAYDVCKKVATLQGSLPTPLTLVGDKGTGKSHLLWAIVNHYRANQLRVGVALISAGDFPQKVRNLAIDPAPIQKKHPAVLLVDDMERFKDNMAVLEAVVRTFLDNGQQVVLASRIHPNALPGFSGKFKSLLSSGSIVGMQATGATSADGGMPSLALDRIAGLKQTIEELEQERDRLREMLGKSANGAGEGEGGMSLLEAERDLMRDALQRSEGDLLEARQELAAARKEIEKTAAELDTAVTLVSTLSERLAGLETAQRARIETLDHALADLDRDLEVLAADGPVKGDPALAVYDSLVAEKRAAEQRLDKARREAAQHMARTNVSAGEVQRLLDRTSTLLLAAKDSPLVAEARKNVSEAILCLVSASGGAPESEPDAAAAGGSGILPKRIMPGGLQLDSIVKQAFGDPVEEDEDGEDFTYAEPVPEEDESDTDLNRL